MRNILVVLLIGVLLLVNWKAAEKLTVSPVEMTALEQITEDSDANRQLKKTGDENAANSGKTEEKETEKPKEEIPGKVLLDISVDYVPLPDINPEKVKEKRLAANQWAVNGYIFTAPHGYKNLLKYQQPLKMVMDGDGNYIFTQRKEQEERDWLIKCNPAGDVIIEQSGGSQGWDEIDQLQYHQEMGIVIGGRQTDGRSFLACLNQGNLTPHWIYPAGGAVDAFCTTGQAVVAALENSAEQKIRVIKLNSKGQELWCSEVPGRWPEVSVTELSDGRVIAMRNNRGEKGGAVMDSYAAADGAKTAEMPMDYYGELTPTDDGGFILVGYRPIKTVPQPEVISAIWFDYETVAAKYDKDFKLEWRKTYDSLKDTIGRDIIIPQPDGSVVLTLSDAPF